MVDSPDDVEPIANCQMATWYTGMGQMTMAPLHGFSHYMTHVLAPYAGVGHSETAAVLMLAQAKWFEEIGVPRHRDIQEVIGVRERRLSDAIYELLKKLNLPTTLGDLHITAQQVEAVVPLAMAHPLLTRFNARPIRTEADIRALMDLAK